MHFDEVYHARTATEFLQDWRYDIDHNIYEWTHPHLAKYAMAAGLVLWGGDHVRATSELGVPVRAAVIEPRRASAGLPRRSNRGAAARRDRERGPDVRPARRASCAPRSRPPGVSALAYDPVAQPADPRLRRRPNRHARRHDARRRRYRHRPRTGRARRPSIIPSSGCSSPRMPRRSWRPARIASALWTCAGRRGHREPGPARDRRPGVRWRRARPRRDRWPRSPIARRSRHGWPSCWAVSPPTTRRS